MIFIVVDDEPFMRRKLVTCIRNVVPEEEVVQFARTDQALRYAANHTVDVAFLNIHARMDGLQLGRQLKQLHPKVNIIFCTAYDDYIYRAFHEVRATGYLFKPISEEDIRQEIENLHVPLKNKQKEDRDIFVQCFGLFEIFYKGNPVEFRYTKTKELFAYLVDRRGALCTLRQIEVELWEDDGDHRKYLTKIKKDLKDTLEKLGISGILYAPLRGRRMGIIADTLICDYYQWLSGDKEAVKEFHGEYMEQYSWAESTKGAILKETTPEFLQVSS